MSDEDFTVGSGARLGGFIHELEEQVSLLKEMLRVSDVACDYHIKRCRLLEQANENANKAIEALCQEIDRLYDRPKEIACRK